MQVLTILKISPLRKKLRLKTPWIFPSVVTLKTFCFYQDRLYLFEFLQDRASFRIKMFRFFIYCFKTMIKKLCHNGSPQVALSLC